MINVSHLFHHITVPPRQNPAIIQQPQVNVDSIFYVHPSEGPNSVTVTPLLTRSNYLAWSRSMQRALGAKNKLSFIDGSIHVPAIDDLNRGAWERCNNLVHSWILNSVSPQIAQTIIFHVHVIDVWEELKERFSKPDSIRVSMLRSAINNLKQGSKYVLDYFTKMKTLWEELNAQRLTPNCICVHPCRCEAMHSERNFRLEGQVIQFSQFSNNITSNPAILSHQEASTPDINTIFSNTLKVQTPIWLIDSGANEHIWLILKRQFIFNYNQ